IPHRESISPVPETHDRRTFDKFRQYLTHFAIFSNAEGHHFLILPPKNKMERKVQILARVGKPSPPGEGANVVSTTGEDSRTDSDLRPSPAVFIRRGSAAPYHCPPAHGEGITREGQERK